MPKVTSYSDVRIFLKDYFAFQKKNNSDWTATLWSQHLGLDSTTALTMILNGQRNIGQTIEEAFIKFFSFAEKEQRHFQLLIRQSKIDDSDPLKQTLNEQISLNTQSKEIVNIDSADIKVIEHWYFFALHQLARLRPIPKDQAFLQSILNCNADIDLCQAVDILVDKKFLVLNDGMYAANDVTLVTTQNISSESIKKIHEEFGKLAVEAVRKYDVQMRNFQSCNFNFSRKNLTKAHQLIEKFVADFETLLDKEDSDSVYQMNVQLFPLAVLNENNSRPI